VNSDPSCIFCKIVAGEKPSHKVLETDTVLAFMDIYPACDGHTLVVPKEHCDSVFHISEIAMQSVAAAGRSIAVAIQAALSPDGMSIVQANGAAAGQTVMHYHWHLLPRTVGRRMRLHGPRQADPERLAELAKAIAEKL
jgi:histidine triad (HIT) family protein